MTPAARNRVLPVKLAGQLLRMNLMAALLAPHKKTARNRPAAMVELLGLFCTWAKNPFPARARDDSGLEQFQDFGNGVLGFDHGHLSAAALEFDAAFGQGFF